MSIGRIAIAGLLLAACAGEADPQDWDERVAIDGRSLVDGGDLVMGFPGTGLRFRADGEVTLDVVAEGDRVALEVREDDGPWAMHRLEPGENTLRLNADGTPSDVRVIKISEDWQGPLRITALDGDTAPLARPEGPRILFIGDSITAGSGTDMRALDAGDSETAGDNARLSYPQYVAERMGADVHHVAYGGRGIIRDWEDKTYEADAQLNAPQLFELAAPSYGAEWAHCDWVPDAVVIGLGTNDFNPGIPERERFVGAMAEFIRTVQSVSSPGAPVLLVVSPMFGEGSEKRAVHEDYLAEVAGRFGGEVEVVDAGHHPGHASTLHHPVAREHEAMAETLSDNLSRRLAVTPGGVPDACRN